MAFILAEAQICHKCFQARNANKGKLSIKV